MTIKNFKDKLIQVQSDKLDTFLSNIADYDSIEITVKQGCNGIPIVYTILADDILNSTWVIDLTEGVNLENTLYELFVKNFKSDKEFNIITSGIDLGYVADTCALPDNSCTLETYSGHFAPLFKAQIDTWFSSAGIVGVSCTVSFSGNKIIITDIPEPFGISKLGYGIIEATSYTNAGFAISDDYYTAIILNEGLFIAYKFFGDTELIDEVYSVTLKFNKVDNSGYILESMCAFIDVKTRCLVAAALSTALSGELSDDTQSAILLHYGLTNGSNCGCNCADLCAVYNQLLTILGVLAGSSTSNIINDDCNCN